jgi:hypothetical protein
MIAQPVLAPSCELTIARLASSSTHFCSALAAAHPDDVDERFAGHWYSRPWCALALLLVTPSQGRRGLLRTTWTASKILE